MVMIFSSFGLGLSLCLKFENKEPTLLQLKSTTKFHKRITFRQEHARPNVFDLDQKLASKRTNSIKHI